MTTDTLVRERPLTRVGQHGLAGSDGQAIRPKFELVKVEDQMPLDLSEVVDLVPTEALRAAADKRRAILDHIPPNKPEARSVETSRLKLAERELRFGEWRDERAGHRARRGARGAVRRRGEGSPMTQSMSRDIPLALIDRDPGQPRRHFDDVTLGELADSVRASGLAVLIMVRPVGERFAIVQGERRWRAAGLLGWETIRAEVRDVDEDGARWLALVENVQRADLTPIEEATAFRARLDGGMTQEALGQRIGKGQSYIAQKLRLLALPAPIRLYLECGALTEGHGRQLLRMKAMYGGLETTFRPGTLDDWPPEVRGALPEVGEARRLALWFNVIRIEDHPIMFVEPRDERETRLFAEVAELARRPDGIALPTSLLARKGAA